MDLDLFGHKRGPKTVHLSVFCDERKIPPRQSPLPQEWTYICLVLIPDACLDQALQKLQDVREKHGYQGEVAFRKVWAPSRRSQITAVAKDWLLLLKAETGMFYWYVLGVARHNLNFACFGPGDDPTGKYANIYNRFFRTAFLGAVNSFFSNCRAVRITNIFHDCEGNLQAHQYFDWHLEWKVSDSRVSFGAKKIVFVCSDHQKETAYPHASHVVQLSDVLIGAVSQCLDDLSAKPGKNEVADVVCPVLQSMMGDARGTARGGGAAPRTCSISFFPSKKLSNQELANELSRASSTFFRRRRLLMCERRAGLTPLPGVECG